MSVLSHGVRPKFVQFLRGLLRRPEITEGVDQEPGLEEGWTEVDPFAATPAGREGSPPVQRRAEVQIPLQAIISGLPLELRAKVRQTKVDDLAVPVALEKILSQLARGAVKLTFGEIRQAAPNVFSPHPDSDHMLVVLPLGEILARLNPSLLMRRTTQRQVEVPADISSPFDEEGGGLVFSAQNAGSDAAAPIRRIAPAPETAIPPARRSITSVPAPAPASTPPPTPALSRRPPMVAPVRITRPPVAPSRPVPPVVPAPVLAVPPLPPQPAAVPPTPPPAAPTPVASRWSAVPVRPASEPALATLSVALPALAEGWPEALRHEIVQLGLVEASVALPVELVETSLKRGRVAFPWKTLRSWIRPVPQPTVSAHDNTELELPLKVIAPLFLARQKESRKSHLNVTVDEAIPNLFFGFPKSEGAMVAPVAAAPDRPLPVPATPVTKAADTNYYVWDDTSDVAHVDETEFKRKQPTGTEFITRCATPNEIVSRAAALDGVLGALIALPDGLMVANRIPPELNGDTLAAFLPQIFAKVSQSTKELRMGELNNLNFTVGNVPWKIFRVNAIFFAVFGRAGEPLPTARLAALAAELDRKKSN